MNNVLRRFTTLLMLLLLLTNVFSFAAFGVDGDEFSGGDGSETRPYLVSTPEQLNNVRNHLDSYFKQTADIDMASISNWQPIGNAGSSTGSTLIHELPEVSYEPFTGSYDGNNYRISNLSINDSKVSFASDVYGLFSALGKCTIKNVHLIGINFSIDKTTTDYVNLWNEYGASYGVFVGGIAGKGTGDSLVSNCSCSGTISVVNCNDAFVGGILGYGKVTKCENSTNIYVNANASSRYETDSTVHCGGIVGHTPSVNGVLSECLNQGTVNATAGNFLYVGGISGEYGRIEDCMNCGNIEGHIIKNSGYSSFAGNCNVGGIVGATSSDYTKYCVNYGNVSASTNTYTWSASSYAGGIVGYCGYYGSGKVFNCVNVAERISSTKKDSNNQVVDASAGRIAGMSISISECYSINTTTVNGSSTNGNSTNSNGEGVNEASLLTHEPYKDFDFNSVWSIDTNLGGAVLSGFYTERIDTDGDGLLDVWETEGLDCDGDGTIDVDLPAMGADPDVPDVFVEVDWMVRPQKKFLWWETQASRSMAPSSGAMRLVYNAFRAHGIHLHIDVGSDSTDFVTGKKWGSLSGGNEVPYETMFNINTSWESTVNNNFSENRVSVFKHCLFINQFDGTTSGIANDIPGQFFIVANQDWVYNGGNTSVGGTFMHELGHTLGLCHGGCDHEHYKPNYPSVMNYAFQTTGLVGTGAINYSDYKLPDLDENHINENSGVDSSGLTAGTNLGTTLFYRDSNQRNISPISNATIDFNNNGTLESDISIDLNPGGNVQDPPIAVLRGHEDWSGIIYDGGEIGKQNSFSSSYSNGISFPISETGLNEKTLEESLETATLASDGTGYVKLLPSSLIVGLQDQYLAFEVGNLSSTNSTFDVVIKCDKLFNSFSKSIAISGSKDKIESKTIKVPISKPVLAGPYSISCSIVSGKKTSEYTFIQDAIRINDQDINEMKQQIADNSSLNAIDVERIEAIISTYEKVVPTIKINNFKESRTEAYKATLTFSSTVTDAPEGSSVHWFVNGNDSGTGENYTVRRATKSYTIQAKLVDQSGNTLAESETETVNIKTGFFARLLAFFRMIFGLLPVMSQSIR